MTNRRAGFTLIESCAAAALLVSAIGLSATLLTAVARQRQAAGRHARAALVADNLLERLTALPYEQITDERAADVCRAADLTEWLPGGEARITITAEAGDPPGKKIVVEVDWQPVGKGVAAKHRLATWVFRAEEKR